MATLGRSDHSGSQTGSSTNSTTTPNSDGLPYNLDRFLEQDMFDDGTLHGRVPEDEFSPRPDDCEPFYEARAANAIAAFETAFANN